MLCLFVIMGCEQQAASNKELSSFVPQDAAWVLKVKNWDAVQNEAKNNVLLSAFQKASMYKNLRLLFENHKITLRKVDKMVYQLSYLTREYTEGGIMKIKSEEHDDYPDSLVLACRAVTSGNQWHVLDVGKNLQKALFG